MELPEAIFGRRRGGFPAEAEKGPFSLVFLPVRARAPLLGVMSSKSPLLLLLLLFGFFLGNVLLLPLLIRIPAFFLCPLLPL